MAEAIKVVLLREFITEHDLWVCTAFTQEMGFLVDGACDDADEAMNLCLARLQRYQPGRYDLTLRDITPKEDEDDGCQLCTE